MHNGPQQATQGHIPNLSMISAEKERERVLLSFTVLQATPPAVVIDNKLVDDDVYKLRQCAARTIQAALESLAAAELSTTGFAK